MTIILLRCKLFRLHLDQEGFNIVINSILLLFIPVIFQYIPNKCRGSPAITDNYPYLWILAVYICNFGIVKSWIEKKIREQDCKIQEFQMASIPVKSRRKAIGRKQRRSEEITVSYLSVTDVTFSV